MISAGLALLAAFQICLAAAAWRTGAAGRLTGVLGYALAYDSAVVAAGALLGEGRLLESLSAGRFIIHVLGTPLVLPCAALALRSGRAALGVAWATAGALAVLGAVTTLPGLDLRPRSFADTLRYADAGPDGFPVAAVLAIVLLLLIGIAAWVSRGTPWIALGALAVFAASAAAFAAPPLGNLGEALMLAGLLVGLRRPMAQPGDSWRVVPPE
ncbi:hypothetical protein [Streptomyces sp. H27-S2]|uniref:hypothetical protein n=1 Tax=Streptomyces antarcticus TaxID=2996458 RepID=UPI00226F2A19|nr:hypothetical protein [Streptomyces sp. H27-S2]MCY0949107.1 hypothetical protein [Streptomyces sp. H27-S2]